jgi:hypothetical protein
MMRQLFRPSVALTIVAVATLIGGCNHHKAKIADREPPPAYGEYDGPDVKVWLVPMRNLECPIVVEATVPTGGHVMTIDRLEIDDKHARVFVTIEQPAADEMVTQAFETLRRMAQHHEYLRSAEVFVNLTRRGVPTQPPHYQLAAETSGWY